MFQSILAVVAELK